MAHTYEELHDMTVAQVREVAKEIEHEAVHGYSTMHKEQLILAICEALGIEAHVHLEVVGIDKAAIKPSSRSLPVSKPTSTRFCGSTGTTWIKSRKRRTPPLRLP